MNVLVIGAGRGLGRVLSIMLAKRGHQVIAGVRRKETAALDNFKYDNYGLPDRCCERKNIVGDSART